MITIHKYEITVDGPNEIETNKIIQFLHVAKVDESSSRLNVWAVVDTSKDVTTYFEVYGTGWNLPITGRFIGTAITDIGLVWHVFLAANQKPVT